MLFRSARHLGGYHGAAESAVTRLRLRCVCALSSQWGQVPAGLARGGLQLAERQGGREDALPQLPATLQHRRLCECLWPQLTLTLHTHSAFVFWACCQFGHRGKGTQGTSACIFGAVMPWFIVVQNRQSEIVAVETPAFARLSWQPWAGIALPACPCSAA